MKKIISYFRDYLKTEFNWITYLSIAVFLLVCIFMNYRLDFENKIIDSYYGKAIRIFYYFLLYAFAYYSACLIEAFTRKEWAVFHKPAFWYRSIFVLMVLALDGGWFYQRYLVDIFPHKTKYYLNNVFTQLSSLVTILLPFIIFYKLIDKKINNFYGLKFSEFDWKPYVLLIAAMVPLIIASSFTDGFRNYYPTYRQNGFAVYTNIPEIISILIYEFSYGWDFVSTELLFRGFMVLGMVAILGRKTILPMVCVYAFLHFGKPIGETVSAIFGGYILGIIALYSDRIFGGIIIHIGIAWTMEIIAFLQNHMISKP